jgi:hypothetical protein
LATPKKKAILQRLVVFGFRPSPSNLKN